MNTFYKLNEQLCISKLSVGFVSFDETHHFETRTRKVHNTFGFIVGGNAEFCTPTEKIYVKEGEIVFIPEGIRYVSHWSGNPSIRFYSVNFLMPKKSVNLWRNMKLQRVDGADNDKICELMDKMYLSANGTDNDHLKAFGYFYETLSLLLPFMHMSDTHSLPQPLQTAVAYIESNHSTISSVKEIANTCFLSESRLYHLFREYLNVSPISYLNSIRIHAAIDLLSDPTLSIQEIAESLNFHSEYYFRKTFQKVTGELPSKLRRML